MNLTNELVIEAVRFPSGPYQLEGELLYPESSPAQGAVVIAGPHPMLGGDMENNVVREVGAGLAESGLVVLRFNYRGVGQSEGPAINLAEHIAQFWETSHVPDELEFRHDLNAAWHFLADAVPRTGPRMALGYSFGCSLLPGLELNEDRPDALVLVAPTTSKHDYRAYSEVANPILIIAPTDDFASDFGMLKQWYDALRIPKQLIPTQRDGHFYRGHEAWLCQNIGAFMSEQRGRRHVAG